MHSSSLQLGLDVRKMTPEVLAIVGNEEVIAVNQGGKARSDALVFIVHCCCTNLRLQSSPLPKQQQTHGYRSLIISLGMYQIQTEGLSGGYCLCQRQG